MLKQLCLGAQMLLIAFGALVLVPLVTGLDPRVALFTAGLGTLIFQFVTQNKVPIFLASSFAFIAPISHGVQTWGVPATLGGLVAAGAFYVILSFSIRIYGSGFLHRLLPPIVTGPIIMLIGLILAPVAVNMARGKSGDGALQLIEPTAALWISTLTLVTVIAFSLKGRGIFRLLPIFAGILAGYTLSLILSVVNFAPVQDSSWLSMPPFVLPAWNWQAILFIFPVAIAPAIEHFGDILAIGSVTGKDYLKDPGIDRTLLGDGLATMAASALGGPPNTTYSEVTGGVALTRAFDPLIMTLAAVVAIFLSFFSKLGALLQTIPVPVMGGILVLLFGTIAVVGLNTLVKAGQDLMDPRNLIVVGVVLVLGLGGMTLSAGEFTLGGVGLAGIMGVTLNLLLPNRL